MRLGHMNYYERERWVEAKQKTYPHRLVTEVHAPVPHKITGIQFARMPQYPNHDDATWLFMSQEDKDLFYNAWKAFVKF